MICLWRTLFSLFGMLNIAESLQGTIVSKSIGNRFKSTLHARHDKVSLVECILRAKNKRVNYRDGTCEIVSANDGDGLEPSSGWFAASTLGSAEKLTTPWKLLQQNVCMEASGDKSGVITFPRGGLVTAMRLVHIDGGISCGTQPLTNFGCEYYPNTIGVVVVTRGSYTTFLPSEYDGSHRYYSLPGYHANSPALELYNFQSPYYVNAGETMEIYDIQDFKDHNDSNNRGRMCMDVYVQF